MTRGNIFSFSWTEYIKRHQRNIIKRRGGGGYAYLIPTVNLRHLFWCYHHCNDKCYITIMLILVTRKKKPKREWNHRKTDAIDNRRVVWNMTRNWIRIMKNGHSVEHSKSFIRICNVKSCLDHYPKQLFLWSKHSILILLQFFHCR